MFMPFHSAFPCVLAGIVPAELASFVNADRYIYNSITDQPATRCWEAAKKGNLKKAKELFIGEPLNSRRLWINKTFRGGDAHNNYADSIGVYQDLPLYKYWHELMGFKGGTYCRWPHVSPTEEAKQKLKADVIKLGYIEK